MVGAATAPAGITARTKKNGNVFILFWREDLEEQAHCADRLVIDLDEKANPGHIITDLRLTGCLNPKPGDGKRETI